VERHAGTFLRTGWCVWLYSQSEKQNYRSSSTHSTTTSKSPDNVRPHPPVSSGRVTSTSQIRRNAPFHSTWSRSESGSMTSANTTGKKPRSAMQSTHQTKLFKLKDKRKEKTKTVH
jgi:hypothetical protein